MRTVAASSTTRAELGVDHWEIARQDESPRVLVAVTTGYSAEGTPRERIRLRVPIDHTHEDLFELSFEGQYPAVVRIASHTDGSDTVVANDYQNNIHAQDVGARFCADAVTASDSSTIQTSSLHIQGLGPNPGQNFVPPPRRLLSDLLQQVHIEGREGQMGSARLLHG
jgi:hypothetical protein